MNKMRKTYRANTRERARKLLVFYDILLLAVIWLLAYLIHPSSDSLDFLVCAWHFAVSAFFYTLFRFAFRCYHQIWRYGSVSTYAREIAATVFASCCYLAAAYLLPMAGADVKIRFIETLAYALIYTFISLLMRIAYYYLFRLARSGGPLGGLVKTLLRPLTLVDFDSDRNGALLQIALEPLDRSAFPINSVQNIVEGFAIRGETVCINPITKGYINQTFYVETESESGHRHKYLLQKINSDVFKDVDALMDNYRFVTERLVGTLHLPGARPEGCVQTIRVTRDGRSFLRRGGECWRMMTFFDGVYTLDIPDSPETFRQAGVAFGTFLKAMSDVDPVYISTVIPDFHDTPKRFAALEAAVAADVKGRVEKVAPEIAFYRMRSEAFGIIADALAEGRIPTRICHNDCNLNNILFDDSSHLPVAIIDLDTVMPSSPLYDYGDSMRIGTNTAKDDEKDLSLVRFDLSLYEKYAHGYLSACGKMLTKEELELLPFSSLIITAEDGIRFLTDHIQGDTYYNIFYTGQNLDRCRTQLKLLSEMEKSLPDIVRILNRLYAEFGLGVVLDSEKTAAAWKIGSAESD